MADRRLRVLHRGTDDAADTDALVQKLDDTTIEIRVGEEQPDRGVELLAEALTDLLCRVFPRIQITCAPGAEADASLPPGPSELAARLEEVRRHGVEPHAPRAPDVTVHVGPRGNAADLHVDGAGWQAYIGTRPSELARAPGEAACVGPLSAACRGAAWAYLLAMRDLVPAGDVPDSVYWSGLDYSSDERPIAVPEVDWHPALDAVLVGAGSIGGAATFSFARTVDLRGRLDVVDPQCLEAGNFDRAILAPRALSDAEPAKVQVAVDALSHLASLDAVPHEKTVADFVASRPREATLPLTLCAVDSVPARRSIQDCLPFEVINAACDPTNSVVSGHRTGSGACLMCLFMKRLLDREQTLYRMIARSTNLNERMVIAMMAGRAPLQRAHLREIEGFRGLPRGALADYEGRTLRSLWHGELVYGGHTIQTSSGGAVVVAAPWVTALAGFLLASEALKAGAPALLTNRLGPWRAGEPAAKYEENPYASPRFGLLTAPTRWEGEQCLCNSPRRRRLMIERYGLSPDEYPI